MINVLGEPYYLDLDLVEEYIGIPPNGEEPISGDTSEIKINLIRFDLVKMLLDTVLTEHEELDETLGMKQSSNTSIPFRIAFNSLLNKKLINHY
jgi:hypothetical protein